MKLPKFFWTIDEGKWIAFDKICHVILHFSIVVGCRFLGADLILSFLISQAWGWLYEWLWDCWLVGTPLVQKIAKRLPIIKNMKIETTGASKKDIICNIIGAVTGLVI